ncbi:hypothetical protein KGM_210889 [Danaus plexippus plexippus]|uniref:Uncharacterized protein n=1 Tax=Danaus plexippus plexippus TaxID=278856 RepID=A0A212EMN1_DANPL|nr:hypothetical protein KGM_210889 [Danaus plexippus plexippus]
MSLADSFQTVLLLTLSSGPGLSRAPSSEDAAPYIEPSRSPDTSNRSPSESRVHVSLPSTRHSSLTRSRASYIVNPSSYLNIRANKATYNNCCFMHFADCIYIYYIEYIVDSALTREKLDCHYCRGHDFAYHDINREGVAKEGQMLFPGGEGDAEAHESSQGQHGSPRHRHSHQTLRLHTLVYLTLLTP